jgi:hypothetical protein
MCVCVCVCVCVYVIFICICMHIQIILLFLYPSHAAPYQRPHAAIYCCTSSVLILLLFCPNTARSVSSYRASFVSSASTFFIFNLVFFKKRKTKNTGAAWRARPRACFASSACSIDTLLTSPLVLYVCPHTAVYVSSYCCMYMCPHTAVYVSSHSCICVLILLVLSYLESSYCYTSSVRMLLSKHVLILLYMCRMLLFKHVLIMLRYVYRPHTAMFLSCRNPKP